MTGAGQHESDSSNRFNFTLEQRVDYHLVSTGVGAELDTYNSPAFSALLTEALENDACQRLIIDLSDTRFIDGTTLGALMRANRQAQESQKVLSLFVTKPSIKAVFRITGVEDYFDFIDGLPEDKADQS